MADSPITGTKIIRLLDRAHLGTTHIVTGPKQKGSEPPLRAAVTQARVDALVALGVSEDNILWRVSGEEVTPDITIRTAIDRVTIRLNVPPTGTVTMALEKLLRPYTLVINTSIDVPTIHQNEAPTGTVIMTLV